MDTTTYANSLSSGAWTWKSKILIDDNFIKIFKGRGRPANLQRIRRGNKKLSKQPTRGRDVLPAAR